MFDPDAYGSVSLLSMMLGQTGGQRHTTLYMYIPFLNDSTNSKVDTCNDVMVIFWARYKFYGKRLLAKVSIA
jgi:hypothetical protein